MLDALWFHLVRRAAIYLWLLVAAVTFGRYCVLTVNVSDSLPGILFLVLKNRIPDKGELAAFRYAGGGPYERNALFLKRVVGVPGSTVSAREVGDGYRDYFVDKISVGRAKPYSKAGLSLEPGQVGMLPAGHYYMAAPNPDSLDSRYALVGWVGENRIVGRVFRLF